MCLALCRDAAVVFLYGCCCRRHRRLCLGASPSSLRLWPWACSWSPLSPGPIRSGRGRWGRSAGSSDLGAQRGDESTMSLQEDSVGLSTGDGSRRAIVERESDLAAMGLMCCTISKNPSLVRVNRPAWSGYPSKAAGQGATAPSVGQVSFVCACVERGR
jgi:hypothetical protein